MKLIDGLVLKFLNSHSSLVFLLLMPYIQVRLFKYYLFPHKNDERLSSYLVKIVAESLKQTREKLSQ